MSEPTHQEILDAHNALVRMGVRLKARVKTNEHSIHCLQDTILKALPPKPRLTMAEIEWDDDVHYLAEAENENGDAVIMLGKDASGRINIAGKGFVGSVYANLLTPTGKRYALTEVQDD